MEFDNEAVVLAARPHGETGAIVEVLTADHGKYAAHVAGGASRRMKALLQVGTRVQFHFRARLAEQLGSASFEAIGEGPSAWFDDPLALAGLAAAAAVTAGALAEREPHPGAYFALIGLMATFGDPDIWPAVFVRFEAGLLQDLGFGLDLAKCAATGVADNLTWVSPRTGRAVSSAAGETYRDRLLALPPFMLSAQAGLAPGDVAAGLALTGHFLETFVFANLDRPLPAARARLADVLAPAGRG